MQYGFWSVVPPILTIVLALVTKNVFFSLLIGIFTSSMVLCGGSPLTGLNDAFYSFIHTFESSGNTITLISFLLIGALIYLIEKSGGVEGFTEVMLKKRALIKTKRGASIFTWLLGIIILLRGLSVVWLRDPSPARSMTRSRFPMKSRRSSSTQPQRRGASSFRSAAGLPP